MGSAAKEIASELFHLIRVYKDGSVERLEGSPYVPPSPNPDPQTGISSKDITISENPKVSARLYLPKTQQHDQKLPILVYFHGSGFCLESAFSFLFHRYMNLLVSQANVVVVSVEYRLAPEHPLPAAYDDCWAALNWVASHSSAAKDEPNKDPWLLNYGDLDRLYIGGDSAGGNIAHNIAMRAGSENLEDNVKILGTLISHSYFWGSKPIGSENDPNKPKPYATLESKSFASDPSLGHEKSFPSLVWSFVYPSAPGGLDNPMLNPEGPGAPSLAGLGCSRLLIVVAGEDELRDRGVRYHELVKESGWKGELDFHEDEGEVHGFHALNPETVKAKNLIKRIASFLK
ncbi:2-hydroxyisoflavanone dehydratase-like [Tripterygium wilfordii]|uniref:2-hydroxyisoflavanone dehydratase-like n=1 Tax=Tripterygium wilfordii TaxID=458696 RepID=UPI0018F85314|nr:2-hydroxyisoflavanone dehydratase-like [Tripterygium wilfordii]